MAPKPHKLNPDEIDKLTLEAIRSGSASNGAIAANAKIGVTAVYQAVSRLVESGQVAQAANGALSIK